MSVVLLVLPSVLVLLAVLVAAAPLGANGDVALVLQVIPFGFNLISQGPTVRAISGQLFALGVVYFLIAAARFGKFRPQPSRYPFPWLIRYVLVSAQAVILLQLFLRLPWPWAGTLINILALLGLGIFLGLAVVLLLSLGRHMVGRRQSV